MFTFVLSWQINYFVSGPCIEQENRTSEGSASAIYKLQYQGSIQYFIVHRQKVIKIIIVSMT